MSTLKLFISHVSSHKIIATNFASRLKRFNIQPFVAHEDIEPTANWQEEIENFLFKTDCMLILATPGYSTSAWCNQEVGFALGQAIPCITVRLGEDPKGFVGKWQAYTPADPIDYTLEAWKLVNLIRKQSSVSKSIRSWVIDSFDTSASYNNTNDLCDALKGVSLTVPETDRIKTSFFNNGQVWPARNIENILDKRWVDTERKKINGHSS